MRKHFLCLFIAVMAMTINLKAQTIVFTDGFENGNLDKWTMEAVEGNTAWSVESVDDNLLYPANVFQGTKRAYLRNTTGETQGFVTRLISPVMKLDTVYQPILIFWYANPKWTGDNDVLRVLYKTGDKASWKELQSYSTPTSNWTKVTLSLPEYTESYQIAFEGTDHLGRGIVLDSVVVRSAPECTVPKDFVFTSGAAGKATISWQASWDAAEFEVVVAKETIGIDTLANIPDSLIAYHDKVDGLQHYVDLTLTSGESFYLYVRSICDAENSDWSESYNFRMMATKYVPYFYDFNMDYTAGYINRDPEWTWGNNTGKFNPFLSTNLSGAENAKYSQDASVCLVFSGANNLTTAIPAGKYAYAATPAISDSTVADFKLSDCQVRFFSTVYAYTGAYAHSIIVGVMTQPEDFTTFVPVDTVSVWGYNEFQENIVSLENYEGEGAYVAFVSNFDKQNIFYIDNMTIERRPAVNKVTKVTVNPRDTFATISWEATGATSYKVLVANVDKDADQILAANIIDEAVVTTNSYVCNKLEANHNLDNPYYVYVKADTLEWSYRKPFTTLARKELPITADMEQSSGYYIYNYKNYPNAIGVYSNDADLPYLYTTNPHGGGTGSCLYMVKDVGNDAWVTFPVTDSLVQKLQISFFLSGNTTPAQAHATVGVMTNPLDINTFVAVADFQLAEQGYYRCYTNFKNYTGDGDVIAIKWTDTEGSSAKPTCYIDDVTIEELGTCVPPSDAVLTPTDSSIVMSWPQSEITSWEVAVSKTKLSETEQEAAWKKGSKIIILDTLSVADPADDPKFEIAGLDWSTSYYIYIRSLCGGDNKSWAGEYSVRTACPDAFALPYTEGFEKYSGNNLGCWQGYNKINTAYPKVYTGAYKGNMALELYSSSTTYRSWVAAPLMEEPLSNLLVDFYARPYSTTATSSAILYVGSTNTPEDPNSIVFVDTINLSDGTKYGHYSIDFSAVANAGQYLVLSSGLADTLKSTSDVLVDEVRFQKSICAAPYNIHAEETEQTSFKMAWDGKSEAKWQILVLDTLYPAVDSVLAEVPAKYIKVNDSVDATVKTYSVSGLSTYTKYYVYVRPTCGLKEWAVDSVMTECFKIKPGDPRETFEEYTDATTSYNVNSVPACWLGGNMGPSTSTSYLPYVYQSTTYANSDQMSLKLYGSQSTTTSTCANPAWIAAPEIDTEDMSKVVVNFYFYALTSYYCLYGVMTDPTDYSTFVTLDSIKGTGKSTLVTVDLSDYKDQIGTAKYFAWRTQAGKTAYIYLDDISFLSGTCPLAKPSISDLQATSARISGGIRTVNDWWLLLTDKQIPTDSLEVRRPAVGDTTYVIAAKDTANIVLFEKVSSRSKTLTNLESQNTYYVYAQCDCDTLYGAWAEKSFITPCEAVTPEGLGTIYFATNDGYTTGNAGKMPCWTKGSKTGATAAYIPFVEATASNMYNGNNYLKFWTTVTYDGGYAIMPPLNVDDISKYQVSFFGRGYNATTATTLAYGKSLIVGVVTDPSDLSTFVALDTVEGSNTAYESFTITFDNYISDPQGNKGKYIMFLSEFGKTNYFYMTGITVSKIPSCRPSYNAVVDSVSEDAAVISWKGYTTSYNLKVAKEIIEENDKSSYTDWVVDTLCNSSDSILIKGLAGGTIYYAYIQSNCAEDTTFQMGALQFRTECPVTNGYEIPYYETFDKVTKAASGVRPDCWEGFEWDMNGDSIYKTQTYPYVGSTVTNSYDKKGNYLYLYSSKSSTTYYSTYAVAPKVDGDLNSLMVSFYLRKITATAATYGKTLRVGYVTDWSSEAKIKETFVKLADVDAEAASTSYVFCSVNLETLAANIPAGARIALYADPVISSGLTAATTYGNFYLDNFKIGLPPSCYAPTVEAGKTTLSTADVKITPARENNTQWQLSVIKKDVYNRHADKIGDIIDNPDSALLVIANDTNFTITGLENGTIYEIYARTICGGEDGNSEWSDVPVEVITKFYYKDGYFFGFEKSEGWILSKYSTAETSYIHPAIETGYYGGTASTSSSYYPYSQESSTYVYNYGAKDQTDNIAALRLYGTSTYYGGYAIFPAVDSAQTRSFEFKVRNGYLSASTMKVTATYASELEIGLVDKNGSYDSYKAIANINMPALNKTVAASATNDYYFKSVTFDLDSATVADKQVVLRLPKLPATSSYAYVFVDNVTMGAAKGYGLVSLDKVKTTATTATATWFNLGGPWNLTVYTTDSKGAKKDTVVSYANLTETSKLIEGLSAQTTYIVELVAANAPAGTEYMVSDSRTITTPCVPLTPDADGAFVWDFNDPTQWEQSNMVTGTAKTDTAYYKPECFTTGSTYALTTASTPYNWLIQRKGYGYTAAPTTLGTTATSTARYEYGRDDSPALRVYSYSTSTYMTPYIVLPELNCGLDTMMIEFWGRCFANYASDYETDTNRNKMISTTYLGTSYGQSLVVGTLTDPTDFSTLEVIDTVTYTAYTSTTAVLVTADPAGNRYWQKFQLPLGSTSGKYIVLFQPKNGLFFLDDLTVKPVGTNVFAPSNGKVVEFGTDTVALTWTVKHPTFQSVITLMDMDNNVLRRDTVSGNSIVLRGLEPGSQYQWSVKQINGSSVSTEAIGESFILECLAFDPNGYSTGFESDKEAWTLIPGQTTLTYKQNKCWVYGNAGTAAWSSSLSYNLQSTSTASYAHSGNFAVKLYATSTTKQGYIAMPAVEDTAAYDTLQVEFWLRAGYHNPGTGKIATQYTKGTTASTADYYYARSVIVGTMTDPNDASTFVAIDTIKYQTELTAGTAGDAVNEGNNYLFEKAVVPLRGATGPYVAFMSTLYAKGETRKSTCDYIYLDDIAFNKLQECTAPTELNVTNVEKDGATLNWTGCELSEKFVVEVSSDLNFEDETKVVYKDTVDTTTLTVSGLDSYTQYVWRVSSLCQGDAESDYSINATFTTLRSPYYLEDFRETNLDAEWSFGTTPIAKVMDDTLHAEITGANSTTYGFKRITSNYGMTGAHYYVPFYSSSAVSTTTYDYYWMISPVLALNDSANAIFTMDMALTQATYGYSATDAKATATNVADDFVFAVAVSENAGETWTKDNILTALVGQNLLALNTPSRIRLDLSKYKGKKIRIGLYREAQTYKSPSAALHFGNIRVNYVDSLTVDTAVCQYNDIEAYDFKINGDSVTPGLKVYNRLQIATESEGKAGARDTIYTLSANVYEAPSAVLYDTICEGDTYSSYDFHALSRAGEYARKLQAVNDCDSIVRLFLTVNPRQYTNLDYTICQGDSLEFPDKFIGQTLNRTGVYTDTLIAATGCDSIITLALTVAVPVVDTTTAVINEGETYTFYGQEFTEAGTYNVVIPVVGGGCDTTHVLVLEVLTALDNVNVGTLTLLPNFIHAGQTVVATGEFSGNVRIEVYDIVGRQVMNENRRADNRMEINAFDQTGVYTVRLTQDDKSQFVGRVIVQ